MVRPEPVFVGASQMRMRVQGCQRSCRTAPLRAASACASTPGRGTGPPERLALCPPQEMPHASCYHEPLMRGRVGGRVASGLRAENHVWRGYRARMVFLQISVGSEGTGSKDSLISVTWMAGCGLESPTGGGHPALLNPVPRPLIYHTQEEGVLAPGRHT